MAAKTRKRNNTTLTNSRAKRRKKTTTKEPSVPLTQPQPNPDVAVYCRPRRPWLILPPVRKENDVTVPITGPQEQQRDNGSEQHG
jgi:hypothetical protein